MLPSETIALGPLVSGNAEMKGKAVRHLKKFSLVFQLRETTCGRLAFFLTETALAV